MGRTFFLDSERGRDDADGGTPERAWKSLGRAMRQDLRPGDSVRLKRGCAWSGRFMLRGSGEEGRPIALGTYGEGPRPRITSAVFPVIGNEGPVSWWLVKGLELRGSAPYDPYGQPQGEDHGIFLHQASGSRGLAIEDCVVHDLSGTGIAFSAEGLGATAHREWRVSGCEVHNTGTGIATAGPWPPAGDLADAFMCHADFKIQDCRVHDIATDGIVLHYCQDGLIEGCVAWRTGLGRAQRTPVGIWLFLAARCVIQRCEAFDNHAAGGRADGGGFDLDGGCVDCVMQYNYSHDNDGAGFLICSYDPGKAPCLRCVARFNLSVNDGRANGYASIQFWQADDCLVHNNTCIARISSCLKFASETRGNLFADNIFVVDSDADIPLIDSAFALDGNRFEGNRYWRSGGAVSLRVKDFPRVAFADRGRFLPSRDELEGDPCLSALSGPAIYPMEGSFARGKGKQLLDLGTQGFHGLPLGRSGEIPVSASVGGDGRGGRSEELAEGSRHG